MANAPAPQSPAAKADEFDRKDLTRIINRVKHELGGLVDDANRRSPFYAPTKEKAVAKREAAVKALHELAGKIEALKKEDN